MIKEKKLPYNILLKLDNLISNLKDKDYIVAFYIFGSGALFKLKPLSDLDFAVLFNKMIIKKEMLDIELKLQEIISDTLNTDETDLVVLNDAPPNFVKNIINDGKLLFCNNKDQLIDFVEITSKRYLDFIYFRDQFLGTFRQFSGIK